MDEKFKKKIEAILNTYALTPVTIVYNAMLKEIFDIVQEAYFQGWSDAKDDSFEEDCLKDDGNWAED